MSQYPSNELPILEDAFSPAERLAEQAPASAEERRIADRVEVGGPVRYRFPTIPAASTWSHGVVVNLSQTGGCFLVDGGWSLVERMENDEWIPLDVELHPETGGVLRLRTEIMWVQPDGGGDSGIDRVGARFSAVEPEDIERLRTVLDTANRGL